MSLRERVIKGFVHTYIENEEKIVKNLLQTGRMNEEEWKEIADTLEEKAEAYLKEEKTPRDFIKERRREIKQFDKAAEEKKKGMTGDKASKLYNQIKHNQRKTLEKAYIRSGISTVTVLAKTLSARVNYTFKRLKNI